MDPRCERGEHLPLVGREKYDAAGGVWAGYGECPRCWGTVKVTREREAAQLQKEAAGQAAQRTGALPSSGSTTQEGASQRGHAA